MTRYHLQITAEYDDDMQSTLDEIAAAGLITALCPDVVDLVALAAQGEPMILRVLKD